MAVCQIITENNLTIMAYKRKTLSKEAKVHNKEIENYNWFVVLEDGYIDSGFEKEYPSDAKERVQELKEDGIKAKVVSLRTLQQMGLKDPRENWKSKIGSMNKRFKKGSKEAKDFMAKLRAKKSTPKKTTTKKSIVKNIGAYKRKTQDEYEIYAYYPTGKEVVYTASTNAEARSIIKDYKLNEPRIRFTMGMKRAKKLGSTLLLEKKETKRTKPKRILQVDRTRKGTFKKFRTISGVNHADDVKKLRQLATQSKSPLFKKVASILISKKVNGGYSSLQSVIEDVQHGLQSGIISELIYYKDTLAWFKKYKVEISKMLRDSMSEMGVDSPKDVFGRNWDDDDYFANDTHNQNLLSWFSFEETTRNIGYSLGYEL